MKIVYLLFLLVVTNYCEVSAQNSIRIGDILPHLREVGLLNNEIFFSADDGIFGDELWKTDGTASGTKLVKDIHEGTRNVSSSPRNFLNFKGSLYFFADFNAKDVPYSVSASVGLFKTDGSTQGTVLVARVGYDFDNIQSVFEYENKLYFLHGTNFWVSDGTPDGTSMLDDFFYTYELYQIDNSVYYFTSIGIPSLVRFDLDSRKKTYVKRFNSVPLFDNIIVSLNNILYFTADDGNYGSELWKSDGTEAGTVLFKNIKPRGESSSPQILTILNNKIYFTAIDGEKRHLFQTDGSDKELKPIKDKNGFEVIIDYSGYEFYGQASKRFLFGKSSFTDEGYLVLNPDFDVFEEFKAPPKDKRTRLFTFRNEFYYIYNDLNSIEYYGNVIKKINPITLVETTFKRVDKPLGNWIIANQNLFFTSVDLNDIYAFYSISLCTHNAKINTPDGTSFCKGTSLNISAEGSGTTGPFTYKWSDNSTNAKLTVTKVGNYTVEVSDSQGCKVLQSVSITEYSNLSVTITGAAKLCQGTTTPLTAKTSSGIAPYTYQWSKENTNVGTNVNVLNASESGSYKVLISDAKGCTGSSSSFSLTSVASPPPPILSSDKPSIITGDNVTITATISNGLAIQWFYNSSVIPNATTTTYLAKQAGEYHIQVTNGDGCSTKSSILNLPLITSIESQKSSNNSVMSIFPNPINEASKIVIDSKSLETVVIKLIDLNGKIISKWDTNAKANHHEFLINLSKLPSGVYLIKAEINNEQLMRRIVIN